MADRFLGIYLNDHLAGSVAAEQVARRILSSEEDGSVVETVGNFTDELEEDRAQLIGVMQELGVARNPIKSGAAWAAEKVGRLKLNGRLVSRSPLSLVEELEFLVMSVEGKLAMWRTLREVKAGGGALADLAVDVDRLIERGNRQRDTLERLRLEAAARAFSD